MEEQLIPGEMSAKQALKEYLDYALRAAGNIPKSRELSLVITKIEEAQLWHGKLPDV